MKSLTHLLPLLMPLIFLISTCQAQQVIPRIINGVPTDEFESVGIVGSIDLGGFCSGTLISPFHVLTAAHCAVVIEGPRAGTFEVAGQTYTTSQIFVHPEYDPRNLANDLAILELSDPILDVVPSQTYRGEPEPGLLLTIVGFGSSEVDQATFGEKMAGTTIIDEVFATLIVWEFDDLSESNTAPGDSGGPGYLDVEGELFIASITSGGTEPSGALGDVAFNTRVDAFQQWIDDIVLGPIDDGEEDEASEDADNRPGHRPHGSHHRPHRHPSSHHLHHRPQPHRTKPQPTGAGQQTVRKPVEVAGQARSVRQTQVGQIQRVPRLPPAKRKPTTRGR